jgi:hypothetical protein
MSIASRLLPFLVGAAVATPTAASAATPNVLDWTPPDAEVVLANRMWHVPRALTDTLERRLGQSKNVRSLVQRLRATEVLGTFPGTGAAPAGLLLEHGAGVFTYGDGELRFVVGATEAASALQGIARTLGEAGLALEVTADGLRFTDEPDNPLTCGLRAPFLVCDSGPLPSSAPGRPTAFVKPPVPADGDLFFWVRQQDETTPQVWLGTERLDDGFAVEVRVEAPAALGFMTGLLSRREGPSPLLAQVDRRSSMFALGRFDIPALTTLAAAAVQEAPLRTLLDRTGTALTGDLLGTLDGSFLHPVLVLGVTSREAAVAWLDAVATASTQASLRVERTDTALRFAFDVDGQPFALSVPWAYVDGALVFGRPADVARRVEGRVQPWPKSPEWNGAQYYAASTRLGVSPAIVELDPSMDVRVRGLADWLSALWTWSALVEQVEQTATVEGTAFETRIRVRLL